MRVNRYRVFDPHALIQPAQPIEQFASLPLGQEWLPRFIKRHRHLKVRQGRRIDIVRMNGATEPILRAWFTAYKELISKLNIK